jgi:HEPN domain-containing protein
LPSREQTDYARLLLNKAQADLAALRVLCDRLEVADDILGFHAQQAIEKALKAILVFRGAESPRTHDLGFLLELASTRDLDVPDAVAGAAIYTPWAVEFRYDDPIPPALDRHKALADAEDAVSWATQVIDID